jgi:hypothetical protein
MFPGQSGQRAGVSQHDPVGLRLSKRPKEPRPSIRFVRQSVIIRREKGGRTSHILLAAGYIAIFDRKRCSRVGTTAAAAVLAAPRTVVRARSEVG